MIELMLETELNATNNSILFKAVGAGPQSGSNTDRAGDSYYKGSST